MNIKSITLNTCKFSDGLAMFCILKISSICLYNLEDKDLIEVFIQLYLMSCLLNAPDWGHYIAGISGKTKNNISKYQNFRMLKPTTAQLGDP